MGCKLKDYILLTVFGVSSLLVPSIVKAAPANPAFKDDNFYKCVVDAYNKKNSADVAYNHNLTDEQLTTIDEIKCYDKNINNVVGINKLESLESLDVDFNNLTSLDISKNAKLKWVYASHNKITEFISNKNILILKLNVNNLNSFDISKMTDLFWLEVRNNNLRELNTSNNKYLQHLVISNYSNKEYNKNLIENLDLRNNNILHTLVANNVGLKNVIFGKIDLLEAYNWWSDEEISYEDFINENIWSLEVNLNTNDISTIDVSGLSTLKKILISGNNLKELDISNNKYLEVLDIYKNELTEIDLSNNKYLKELDIGANELIGIDLSKNTNLLKLDIQENNLDSIDLSNNILLEKLDLHNNKFKNLDISKNINLTSLNLYGGYSKIAVVYKGGQFDFSKDYGAIKLPQGYTTIYDSMSSNQNNSDLINGTTITPNGVAFINSVIYNYVKDEKVMGHYDTSYYLYNIEIDSDEYVVKDDYIYATNNTLDIDKIKILTPVINGSHIIFSDKIKIDLIKDKDKLRLYHEEHLIKEFNIIGINFGNLKASKNIILVTKNVPYNDFINNITVSDGLTYKIFNDAIEVTQGNISKGMNLNVYKEDKIIYTYKITDEYLDLSLLNVDEDKNMIKNLSLGTNVSGFKEKISTNGTITILDKNNELLTDDKLITTGSKVKIELPSKTYEYTLSVKGDVTGTGKTTISDVAKLYQYLKKKIDMEECYKVAGDIAGTDSEIKINDVAKLYQYVKKKINSLD